MNEALKEEYVNIQEAFTEIYEYANDDDVMKISRRLIEKHREAYEALGNA